VICRWRDHGGLILDAMPSEPGILGFDNRWQGAAIPHAILRVLPSGATIRAVSPPYLLATKLVAFKGRGNRDFLGSRDFDDIIALVDGREELADEIAQAPVEVREYIASEPATSLKIPVSPTACSARSGPMPAARHGPTLWSCRASGHSPPEPDLGRGGSSTPASAPAVRAFHQAQGSQTS
jgi:hypothetical protein